MFDLKRYQSLSNSFIKSCQKNTENVKLDDGLSNSIKKLLGLVAELLQNAVAMMFSAKSSHTGGNNVGSSVGSSAFSNPDPSISDRHKDKKTEGSPEI